MNAGTTRRFGRKEAMSDYTDIVIGAGSAGAVIAARLSEDAERKVLLVEAGPDFPTDNLPADIQHGLYPSFTEHDWGFQADAVPGREILLSRGKVVGGCSAINTSLAVRPDPLDFHLWSARGLTGWTWDEMLPSFRKLEDDVDYSGPEHGSGGPITVRRWQPDQLLPVQRAMRDVCVELGFAPIDDLNQPGGGGGIAPLPQNLRDGLRVSTAIGYLDPARSRDNLTIAPDTLTDAVVIENGRAAGVRVTGDGGPRIIRGDRIILSAGAIGTPGILMRSGIGPAATVAGIGVDLVADLPGVGANLQDHPACMVTMAPRPGVCDMDDPVCQMLLRYTAPGSADRDDMQIYMYSQIDLSGYKTELSGAPEDKVVFMLSVGVETPRSVGSVTLTSADPAAHPKISLNFLDDAEDLRRMREGVRLAWKIAEHPYVQQYATKILSPDKEIVESDPALDEYLRGSATTHYHPVGTAKMGPPADPMAVVNDRCQVYGIDGLYVADASIMPSIVRANTNLTCLAIGERVAGWLRGQ
jgi:choline dehydrogenase